jgi:Dolichyl-phosphate-mannose-protein mannosyltransferase
MTTRWQQSPLAFIILFSSIVLGAGIWGSSILTQGDESDYIRSSQEMLSSGDLLTPTFREEPRFTKPPLLYWMVVSSYRLFGVSLFSSRLPMVLCGVLTVLFVYRLGLLLFDRKAALMSALVTTTAFGMVKFSKIVLMEVPLTLAMLMASFYFIRFYRDDRKRDLLASFLFIGLSSLLKSPVYSAISVIVLLLFLLSVGSMGRIRSRTSVLAVLLALLVAVPWYAAMIVLHGDVFIDFYYNEHYIKFLYVNHYLFRVWVGLLLYMLPWTFYFLYAVYQVFAHKLYRQWEYKFLLISIFVFLCVFLVPNQKGLYYAIPVVPYAGLLTGSALVGAWKPGKLWDGATAAVLCVIGTVLLAAIVLVDAQLLFSLAAGLLILAAALLLMKRRGSSAVPFILYGLALTPFYTVILPSVNFPVIPEKEAKPIVSGKPLYSYEVSPLKFSDALDRDIREITRPERLQQAIEKGGAVIMTRATFDELRSELKQMVEIRLQWRRWRRRVPFSEVVDALIRRRPEAIQETVYLIMAKS